MEKKKLKYQQIKKGTMELLLTEKVRVGPLGQLEDAKRRLNVSREK